MELTPEFIAWQCIGRGGIESPQSRKGVCEDRKMSFVYVGDQAGDLSSLVGAKERIAALEKSRTSDGPFDPTRRRIGTNLQVVAGRGAARLEGAQGPISRTHSQETLEEP